MSFDDSEQPFEEALEDVSNVGDMAANRRIEQITVGGNVDNGNHIAVIEEGNTS